MLGVYRGQSQSHTNESIPLWHRFHTLIIVIDNSNQPTDTSQTFHPSSWAHGGMHIRDISARLHMRCLQARLRSIYTPNRRTRQTTVDALQGQTHWNGEKTQWTSMQGSHSRSPPPTANIASDNRCIVNRLGNPSEQTTRFRANGPPWNRLFKSTS